MTTQAAAAAACDRCTRPVWSRGLCRVHYPKALRAGLLEPLMVDAVPTRRHIERLLATDDWTRASIARAAGVHVHTVAAIAAGRRRRILETVAAAIVSAAIPRPRQET